MDETTEVVTVQQITTKRGGRYYDVVRTQFSDDGDISEQRNRLYSVTTLIGRGLPKPALTNWIKRHTAERAVEYAETLVEMKGRGDTEPAIQMLTAFTGAARDIAGETGTAIHQAVEALGGADSVAQVRTILNSLDDEIRPYVSQFLAFCEDVKPVFLMQEARCWSEKYGYAGTLDAIVEVDGKRGILDVKSNKKQPYPDACLQLAAYAHSEYVMAEGDEFPTETGTFGIEQGWILHLTPESWSLIPADISDDVFRMFLNVREVGGRWAYGMERDVLDTDNAWKGSA